MNQWEYARGGGIEKPCGGEMAAGNLADEAGMGHGACCDGGRIEFAQRRSESAGGRIDRRSIAIARPEDAQTVAVPRAPVVDGECRSTAVLVVALRCPLANRSIGLVG